MLTKEQTAQLRANVYAVIDSEKSIVTMTVADILRMLDTIDELRVRVAELARELLAPEGEANRG